MSYRYVLPFAVFVVFLALRNHVPWEYPARVIVTTAVLVAVSRSVIPLKPSRVVASFFLGIAVFAVWVAPDVLWPGYRQHWLFSNAITGSPRTSIPKDTIFLIFRVAGAALVVPIIEELFWRAWLMRYLIKADFEKVRLGTYTAFSFWVTAALFASEHGSYWDVGLLAGTAYGWWMVRSRSLPDCILAHAVTNACLAAYVIGWGKWEYWM